MNGEVTVLEQVHSVEDICDAEVDRCSCCGVQHVVQLKDLSLVHTCHEAIMIAVRL